jgi:NAD(P) transhydrogenase subunit alpha
MLLTNLAILVLAGFAGYLTISKVPNTLHTPLMSGTNAIHGIVVLGGIIVLGLGVDGALSKVLLVVAVAFGTINVVGGFLVTDRMLEMFKSKPQPQPRRADAPDAVAVAGGTADSGAAIAGAPRTNGRAA